MTVPGIRPTRIEVDVAALVHNARAIRAHTGAQLMAVIKADGYGHGAIEVAQGLRHDVDGFAVSLIEEGIALRDAGIDGNVLVMGPSHRGGEAELVARGLTPVISDRGEYDVLEAIGRERGDRVEVHLKVDTGMSRLGLSLADAVALAGRNGGASTVGLMTHFACADSDSPDDPDSMTARQLAAFAEAERLVRAAGAPLRVRHAANSAGAMLFPNARFDAVRCGLALYGGGFWNGETPRFGRRQAMRLLTEVALLRRIETGTTVGYGALWTAPRNSVLAVLPVGYADGYARHITGRGQVLIRGKRCPLVGAVSMDILVVDVTDVPAASVGDEAVLLGASADAKADSPITTAELAAWSTVTEYEVTCGMSKRVPRVYVGEPSA